MFEFAAWMRSQAYLYFGSARQLYILLALLFVLSVPSSNYWKYVSPLARLIYFQIPLLIFAAGLLVLIQMAVAAVARNDRGRPLRVVEISVACAAAVGIPIGLLVVSLADVNSQPNPPARPDEVGAITVMSSGTTGPLRVSLQPASSMLTERTLSWKLGVQGKRAGKAEPLVIVLFSGRWVPLGAWKVLPFTLRSTDAFDFSVVNDGVKLSRGEGLFPVDEGRLQLSRSRNSSTAGELPGWLNQSISVYAVYPLGEEIAFRLADPLSSTTSGTEVGALGQLGCPTGLLQAHWRADSFPRGYLRVSGYDEEWHAPRCSVTVDLGSNNQSARVSLNGRAQPDGETSVAFSNDKVPKIGSTDLTIPRADWVGTAPVTPTIWEDVASAGHLVAGALWFWSIAILWQEVRDRSRSVDDV